MDIWKLSKASNNAQKCRQVRKVFNLFGPMWASFPCWALIPVSGKTQISVSSGFLSPCPGLCPSPRCYSSEALGECHLFRLTFSATYAVPSKPLIPIQTVCFLALSCPWTYLAVLPPYLEPEEDGGLLNALHYLLCVPWALPCPCSLRFSNSVRIWPVVGKEPLQWPDWTGSFLL